MSCYYPPPLFGVLVIICKADVIIVECKVTKTFCNKDENKVGKCSLQLIFTLNHAPAGSGAAQQPGNIGITIRAAQEEHHLRHAQRGTTPPQPYPASPEGEEPLTL